MAKQINEKQNEIYIYIYIYIFIFKRDQEVEMSPDAMKQTN